MSWHLAPSLAVLLAEVNARYPKRSKRSDGTIGDKAHSSRTSQHNPDKDGIVRALDITATGSMAQDIIDAAVGDPRVHYVIHDRQIWSRTHGWTPRKYAGSNPHTGHVHISIRNNTEKTATGPILLAAALDRAPWLTTAGTITPTPAPPKTGATGNLKTGSRGDRVSKLQSCLNKIFPAYRHSVSPRGRLLAVDGIFGAHTDRWVKEFQRRSKLAVDGIVGPATIKALRRYGIKL